MSLCSGFTPRLEAAGYTVFADILTLEPGDRWRREITDTLQNKAVKMLLCCRDATLNKNGVQEEIGIGTNLAKELNDPRFIIPLRLEPFRKVFGIGELQRVDLLGSWANGLHELLDTLEKQNVPRVVDGVINPNWENYRKRLATKVEKVPEVLTSNWLRVASLPDTIRYYYPPGPINLDSMEKTCRESTVPAEVYQRGFFSFALPAEIERDFAYVAPFEIQSEHKLLDLLEHGSQSPDIKPRQAQNIVSSMFRRAWESFCRSKGLYQHFFAAQTAFHVSEAQMPLGRRVSWASKANAGPPCCATAQAARSGNTAYPYRRSFGRALTSSSKHACFSRNSPAIGPVPSLATPTRSTDCGVRSAKVGAIKRGMAV
ncbi:MAG TPA: toll/interleukin-1 receptor domain-containing protein [Clostridia bacterium]|nr:toll/interleukin-1 receptor domain-containing protein [Clostridia bacterium]